MYYQFTAVLLFPETTSALSEEIAPFAALTGMTAIVSIIIMTLIKTHGNFFINISPLKF